MNQDIIVEEDDKWGDTELTADNMSAPRLLNEANWKDFFHQKGYSEPFPLVMYAHDEADDLYSALITAAGVAQAPDSDPRLQIRVFTRFADLDGGEVEGGAWLVIEGIEAVDEPLREDLKTLLLSGVTDWLIHSYSEEEITPSVEWVERLPEQLETKDPTCDLSREGLIYRALIRQR